MFARSGLPPGRPKHSEERMAGIPVERVTLGGPARESLHDTAPGWGAVGRSPVTGGQGLSHPRRRPCLFHLLLQAGKKTAVFTKISHSAGDRRQPVGAHGAVECRVQYGAAALHRMALSYSAVRSGSRLTADRGGLPASISPSIDPGACRARSFSNICWAHSGARPFLDAFPGGSPQEVGKIARPERNLIG